MYMAQKAKKKSKLRHAEYYDMQKTFDSLYAKVITKVNKLRATAGLPLLAAK